MSKQKIGWWLTAVCCTILFLVLTVSLLLVDVQSAGAQTVGWASLNFWWHDLISVQHGWHIVSNIVATVTLLALCAMVVWQFIIMLRGKSFRAFLKQWLAFDITVILLVLCYVLFQIVVVNYRPIMIDGMAEVSYPSSHILLFATLLPLIVCECWHNVPSKVWRRVIAVSALVLMVVGIVARALCGYHWLTDSVGALLLSAALVAWYKVMTQYKLPARCEPSKL